MPAPVPPPGGHEFVELPAGLRDAGEEPAVETARARAARGGRARGRRLAAAAEHFSSAGITDEVHEIFLARGLTHATAGDFEMEHEEAEMERFWVPMADLLEAVLEGRVREGPLAQAVLTVSSAAGPSTPRPPGVVSPSL